MPTLNPNLLRMALSKLEKSAVVAPPPPGGAGGMPPMDPAMMGGAPPMDPSMMGGAPPMDPAMAGGAPPMDPAMAGGAPPAPAPAPAPAAGGSGGGKAKIDPAEIMRQLYNLNTMVGVLLNANDLKVPAEQLIGPPPDLPEPDPKPEQAPAQGGGEEAAAPAGPGPAFAPIEPIQTGGQPKTAGDALNLGFVHKAGAGPTSAAEAVATLLRSFAPRD